MELYCDVSGGKFEIIDKKKIMEKAGKIIEK